MNNSKENILQPQNFVTYVCASSRRRRKRTSGGWHCEFDPACTKSTASLRTKSAVGGLQPGPLSEDAQSKIQAILDGVNDQIGRQEEDVVSSYQQNADVSAEWFGVTYYAEMQCRLRRSCSESSEL